MAPISRRTLLNSLAVTGAAAELSILAAGCTNDASPRHHDQQEGLDVMTRSPYEFGAVGDGKNDDTAALQAALDAAAEHGRSAVELTRGKFFIPGHLDLEHPGVSLIGCGGAVVGGGEIRVGPSEYRDKAGGVDFSGAAVSGVIFDGADDYGAARCLVLRNVRGLDVSRNVFRSAGKGIAVEGVDGNDKVHTTAMLRISENRFAKLAFGVYADTREWDTLSDWDVTENYFNYCSDTSVWIASSEVEYTGGVDGLNLSGNTMFSMSQHARAEPLFATKRYNVRLGKSNWLRIVNNSFFEAGLSAVYLEGPQNMTVVGNHVAWPGQRELGDALEIHNGRPIGVVEGNTFALWTRAAIGMYQVKDLTQLEVGPNALNWSESPDSWTGMGDLPGYRVFVSDDCVGSPVVRDYQVSGARDDIHGSSSRQSRDIKTSRGGVTGASRGDLSISDTVTVFDLSDITDARNFGGLISMTATNSEDDRLIATYLLFVSSVGDVCTVIQSGGLTEGLAAEHPSFTWALSGTALQASPVGIASGTYDFDAVSVGAVSLT